MKPFDLRLAGGRVALPGDGLVEVDILVADGKIAALCAPDLAQPAHEVVDITGLAVLPGVIDAHVHLGQTLTVPETEADVAKESRAAAAGGVTTILAYLMSPDPYDSLFSNVKALMEASSLVDFGFHFCISTEEQLAGVERYIRELGVSSFKFFMNFRGDEGKYLNIPGNDDGFLFELLTKLGRSGGMLCPHPENIELVWYQRRQPREADQPPLRLWYDTRPPFVEAEALQRVAYLARIAGAPVYAVHVSCAEALEAACLYRRRHPVYIETCPHYLTHDVDSGVGELGKVNPPLREASDREVLWHAIADGVIDTVGSDHVPRHRRHKNGDIWKAAAGFPGVETLLPVLITEGHHKRGIPLERIVELISTNPARLFGLYPRKGRIGIGSDADFAIVDLRKNDWIRGERLHSGAGYSIYDGWPVSCAVVHTLVRGKFVKRDGQVVEEAQRGRYVPRTQTNAGKGGDADATLGRRHQ